MNNSNSLSRISRDAIFLVLSVMVAFLALVQVLTIGLSLAHCAFSRWLALGVLGVAGAGAAAFGCWLRREARDNPAEAPGPLPPTRIFAWLWPLVAVLVVVVLLNSYLHPYAAADCAIYHLPTIHFWGERGYVHWVDMKPFEVYYTDMFINGYPKAGELMAFVTCHAAGAAGLVHLLNAWFLLIGIAGTAYMARLFGASAGAALFAGGLYALAPVNIVQLNGTYVDSAFAASVVALLAVLAHVAATVRERGLRWPTAIVFGSAAGLVAGIKGSGPMYVLVAGFAAFLLATMALGRTPRGRRLAAAGRALAWLLLVVLAAAAVGGYWYIRNAVHTGNPLFPMAVKVGALVDWPGLPRGHIMNEAANIPPRTAGWPGWKRVADNWAQGGPSHWPFSGCSVSGRLGGLGLAWLLGGLLAIGWMLLAGWRQAAAAAVRRPLWTLLGTTAVLFLLTPMHWWARYTVWLLGVGFACLVVMIEAMWRGRTRRLALAWLALILFVSLVEVSVGIGWVACADPIDWYGGQGPFPPRPKIAFNWMTWQRPVLAVDENSRGPIFNEMMASDHPVAIGPLSRLNGLSGWMMGMFGTVCDPLGDRPVRLLKPSEMQGDDALRRFVRTEKIQTIVWDAEATYPRELDQMAERVEQTGAFRYFAVSDKWRSSEPIATERVSTSAQEK